ncbi:MAG: LuxR C-terminal-related transcriptional regulator [Acidobacteriota bacterium]
MSSTPSETLDRIARSGEAVFAIDSSDRIVLWNKKCEDLLGKPARAVLGKRCYDVLAGRDAQGNIYCYRNCPVAFQAREKASEPVARFPVRVPMGTGGERRVEVSLFAIPSYHPALATVVHVIRETNKKPSALEKKLEKEVSRDEPLWPMTSSEGEPVALTHREQEVLRCLARGMSTASIARKLAIAPVTVRNHIQSILQRLDVHSKLAAVVYAYRHDLI